MGACVCVCWGVGDSEWEAFPGEVVEAKRVHSKRQGEEDGGVACVKASRTGTREQEDETETQERSLW